MSEDNADQTRSTGRIDRRDVLKGLGAAGVVGVFGTGQVAARGPGGGGPPGQSCDCDDTEGEFIAKYDFECVEYDEDDECVEWGFVLAEGEDKVDITVTEVKDGDDEPITVEFSADGYVVQSVCAFGGLDTDTTEDEDGVTEFATDLTNPGGQQAAISNLTFCGVEDEEDPECPELTGEYECTTYQADEPGDPTEWTRTGTRFRIFNDGDAEVDFDLAVSNQPGAWRAGLSIDPDTNRAVISDASVPVEALVIWDLPEECLGLDPEVEGIPWGDFKDNQGYDDLEDWYRSTGSDSFPGDAPEDLDDDMFVSLLTGIPEEEEPDDIIDADDYPDMSDDAEAAGWIACDKL